MNSLMLKIGFILALLLNFVLGAQLYRLKQTVARGTVPTHIRAFMAGQPRLPDVTVSNIDGRPTSLRKLAGSNKASVFVFFTPSDCPDCLQEKELWGLVPERTGLPVYAIATSPDADEFWRWASYTNFPVVIFLDTTYSILDSIDLVTTPMKLVVNSDGQIIWADPPRLGSREQTVFWENIRYVINEIM